MSRSGVPDARSGSQLRQLVVLAKESAIYGFATMATGLIGLILTPVYSRRLPDEDFALVAVLTSLAALLLTTASLSMENAAHRWYWDTDDPDDRGATFTVWFLSFSAIALGLTVVGMVLAPVIASGLGSPGRGRAVVLAVASIPLRVPFLVGMNWLRARRQPAGVIVVSVVQAGVTVALTMALLHGSNASVDRALVAQIVAFGLASAVLLIPARSWWRPRRISRTRYRELVRFSVPLLPAALASWALALADRGLLKVLSDAEQVNQYQVAVTWSLAIGLPVAAFQQAWGPFGLSVHERSDANALYRRVLSVLVGGLTFGGAIAALVAPEVLARVFGASYESAALAGALLGFGQVANAVFLHTSLYFLIARRTGPVGMSFLVGAAIDLALAGALIPHFGANGAAVAMVTAQASMVAFLAWRTRSLSIPTHPWRAPLLIPGLVFGVVALLVERGAGLRAAAAVVLVVGFVLAALIWMRAQRRGNPL